VDSLTHALAAVLVFSGHLQGMGLLAAVLGSVLPDCDILFHTLSAATRGSFSSPTGVSPTASLELS